MRPLLGGLLPRLFASIILPFSVVLFALGFATIGVHERAMRGLVAERDARSVRAAAAAISEVLLHRQIAVREMALRLQDGVAPARLIREAGSLAHDFPEGLAVVSRKGRIVAGSLPAFLPGSGLLERALAAPGGADGLLPPLASRGGAVVTAASTGSPLLVAGVFLHRRPPAFRASRPGLAAGQGQRGDRRSGAGGAGLRRRAASGNGLSGPFGDPGCAAGEIRLLVRQLPERRGTRTSLQSHPQCRVGPAARRALEQRRQPRRCGSPWCPRWPSCRHW